MAKFTDSHGVDWDVVIDAPDIDGYEDDTGDSILAEVATGRIRMRTAWRLAYRVVRVQAEKRGHDSYEKWLRALGKDACGPLVRIVTQELDDFFPDLPEGAEANANPPSGDPGRNETSTA